MVRFFRAMMQPIIKADPEQWLFAAFDATLTAKRVVLVDQDQLVALNLPGGMRGARCARLLLPCHFQRDWFEFGRSDECCVLDDFLLLSQQINQNFAFEVIGLVPVIKARDRDVFEPVTLFG